MPYTTVCPGPGATEVPRRSTSEAHTKASHVYPLCCRDQRTSRHLEGGYFTEQSLDVYQYILENKSSLEGKVQNKGKVGMDTAANRLV